MVRSQSWDKKLPSRAFLIFNNPTNALKHISFLTEGTNDAMVQFLSPLLPLARALGIPVLDFDKYQISRDSKSTGDVVIPLVVDYLKQRWVYHIVLGKWHEGRRGWGSFNTDDMRHAQLRNGRRR